MHFVHQIPINRISINEKHHYQTVSKIVENYKNQGRTSLTTDNTFTDKMTLALDHDTLLDMGLLRKLFQDPKFDFYLHVEMENICKKLFFETSNQNLSVHQRQILHKIRKQHEDLKASLIDDGPNGGQDSQQINSSQNSQIPQSKKQKQQVNQTVPKSMREQAQKNEVNRSVCPLQLFETQDK